MQSTIFTSLNSLTPRQMLDRFKAGRITLEEIKIQLAAQGYNLVQDSYYGHHYLKRD
jgi:hypothetical protein